MSFKITGGKGFHLTFPNGVTVSVQFGPDNYCDNYDKDILDWSMSKGKGTIESNTAEVAMWNKKETWISNEYPGDHDDVIGYQDFEEVWKIFEWARNYHD